MKEKLSKRNKIILAIVTVSLLATFAVLTYAFFTASGVTNNATDSNVTTLTSNYGNIYVRYPGGQTINSEDIVLIEEQGDESNILKFSIENTGSVSQNIIIHWEDLINNFCKYQSNGACTNISTDTDVRNELNYTLYECTDETSYDNAEVGNLTGCTNNLSDINTTMPNTGSTVRIHTLSKITINKETTKYYVFQLTLENLSTEQNYNQNKNMSGKIIVDYASNTTLAQAIEKKYTPISDANIDFSYTSAGCNDATACTAGTIEDENQVTNGLYINNKVNIASDPTQGDIKYFRGTVNNYVTFAGITWRVVRINPSGNVRLITEDTVLPNTAFNPTYDDPKYVGYTYDRTAESLGTAAPIKTSLDSWYTSNLSTYASYINQTAEFCSDASGSISAYGARIRLDTNKTPSFNCLAPISDYGGTYQLPIGTITADEAAYAGGLYGTDNTGYYLNNGTYFWTMSPSRISGGAGELYVNSAGHLYGSLVNDTASGFRAVIELNSDVLSTGEGTIESPWVVQ